MKELAAFAKSVGASDKGPTRTLGSEFLLKAAGMNWGKAVPDMPYVRNATLCCQLASPSSKCIDGFCKLLSTSTVNMITHKKNLAVCQRL